MFVMLLGDVKSPRVVPKPHGSAFSMQPPYLELGFSQPQVTLFFIKNKYVAYHCVTKKYVAYHQMSFNLFRVYNIVLWLFPSLVI